MNRKKNIFYIVLFIINSVVYAIIPMVASIVVTDTDIFPVVFVIALCFFIIWPILYCITIPIINKIFFLKSERIKYFKSTISVIISLVIPIIIVEIIVSIVAGWIKYGDTVSLIFCEILAAYSLVVSIIFSSIGYLISRFLIKKYNKKHGIGENNVQ